MFHEERWIGGVLHIRTTPDGQWRKAPAVYLNARVNELHGLLQAERERRLDDHLAAARTAHEVRIERFWRDVQELAA